MASKVEKTEQPFGDFGNLGFPTSATTIGRTHARPELLEAIKNLAEIFSKTEISSNPIAQLGALDMKQGDIQPMPYRTNAYGITFAENPLPSTFANTVKHDPISADLIKQAGFNIGNLRNKIVLGPEVMSGEHYGTIPHELGHRGQNILMEHLSKQIGHAQAFFNVSPELTEPLMRIINVMKGQNVEDNMAWLNAGRFSRGEKPYTKDEAINQLKGSLGLLQYNAEKYLKERGLKEKPKQTSSTTTKGK